MKKFLLSMTTLVAFGLANAETVTLDCNNAENIKGTHNETSYKADGSVQSYENWKPLESLTIGEYTFSFAHPGESEENTNWPAYYTAKEGSQYTIRLYSGNSMTITAPEGTTMGGIVLNCSNGKEDFSCTVDAGNVVYDYASGSKQTLTWGATEGVANVTFNVGGTIRINTLEITTGNGEEPVEPDDPTIGENVIFAETFASSLGEFEIEDVNLPEGLSYVWSHSDSYKCAKASGYYQKAFATEAWLVSPVVDLTEARKPMLSFDSAIKFAPDEMPVSVWVREEGAEWNAVTVESFGTNEDYTFVTNSDIDLTAYAGKKIQLGFKYTSTEEAACTWEIQNVIITETGETGVVEIAVEENATVEYFNLQGVRVANPDNGIYIRRAGNSVTKVLVK